MAQDTFGVPYKQGVTIAKHFDGDTSREPDEVLHFDQWSEADGTPVTDPGRIAELEAIIPTNTKP